MSMTDKKILRKALISKRDAIPDADRKIASQKICDSILQHPFYKDSDIVLGYAAFRSEPDIGAVLLHALACGKEIYLPKVIGQEMCFYKVSDLHELRPGTFGILEPNEEFLFDPNGADECKLCILVPGVSFTPGGVRLGYGGGYYDRYFATCTELLKASIGVCFAELLAAELPTESHDITVASLIFDY